ncbi:MAG: hypothetical protein R2733_02625 [Acidimicrobiales bacterium]
MTEQPEIEYLDLDDLIALATALLGHPAPIRDLGLLDPRPHDLAPPHSAATPTPTSGPKPHHSCNQSSATTP